MEDIVSSCFADNRRKFNEEAHMLSFVYYKLGYEAKTANTIIKRIWTQLYGTHNVLPEDHSLTIWHLPVEKSSVWHGYTMTLFARIRLSGETETQSHTSPIYLES